MVSESGKLIPIVIKAKTITKQVCFLNSDSDTNQNHHNHRDEALAKYIARSRFLPLEMRPADKRPSVHQVHDRARRGTEEARGKKIKRNRVRRLFVWFLLLYTRLCQNTKTQPKRPPHPPCQTAPTECYQTSPFADRR